MKLYLIRHGATRANLEHLYCGSSDLPLAPEGAAALQELRYEAPEARYLTSGMRRANETMELLFPGRAYETDPRFREVDFGVFELKSYDQLKEDPAYLRWITGDNEKNVPPGGESGEAFRDRVLTALETIRVDTVLVTHGGVIAAIMEARFPEAGKNRYQWQPRPGHGYAVTSGSWQPIPADNACKEREEML